MVQLTEKQEGLLNDYDLRTLAEQFTILRHTDTLSISVLALSFTIFSFIIKPIIWPEHPVCGEQCYLCVPMLKQLVSPLISFFVFLLVCGYYLTRLVYVAQKNIEATHLRLVGRNDIPAEEFYFPGWSQKKASVMKENVAKLSDINFLLLFFRD